MVDAILNVLYSFLGLYYMVIIVSFGCGAFSTKKDFYIALIPFGAIIVHLVNKFRELK